MTEKFSLSRYHHLPILVLVVITTLLYVRSLPHQFVAEDYGNYHDMSIPFSGLQTMLQTTARPRPVYMGFLWIMRQVFGTNSFGYNVVLLGLHIAVFVMLNYFVESISGNRWVAFIAALFFAVYPRNHQTVIWYSANQYLITAFFILIALFAFHLYLTQTKRYWYALSLGAFILALFAQESAIVAFVLLPLLDFFLHSKGKFRERWLSKRVISVYLLFVLVILVFSAVTFGSGRIFKLLNRNSPDAVLTSSQKSENYTINPINLDRFKDMVGYVTYAVYPQISLRSLDVNSRAVQALAVFGMLILAAMFFTQSNLVKFGVLWTVLGFLPYVFFVPFGNADRYFYLPALGLSIAVAGTLYRIMVALVKRFPKWGYTPVSVVIAGYCLFSIIFIQQRIEEWNVSGKLCAEMLVQVTSLYPSVPEGSTIIIIDPPQTYGDVYLFGIDLPLAIDDYYKAKGITVSSFQTSDMNVREFLLNSPPVTEPLDKVYVSVYQDGIFVDRTDRLSDIKQLNPDSWIY